MEVILSTRGDFIYNLKVCSLIPSANIIYIGFFAFMVDQIYTFAVVKYIKPISNVFAVPIDRDRFFCQTFTDDSRNEFFIMLFWAVVIGAVCDDSIEPIGLLIASG